jgi:hypothetical protein
MVTAAGVCPWLDRRRRGARVSGTLGAEGARAWVVPSVVGGVTSDSG